MKVFKGFLIVLRQNLAFVALYLCIFMGIFIGFKTINGHDGAASFQAERLNIAVIDRDKGELARGLAAYLGRHQNLVNIADDEDVISEELFYRNVSYVLIIPGNFEALGEPLPARTVPGTFQTFYVDRQVNDFLNGVEAMEAAGFSRTEAIREVTAAGEEEPEVTLLDQNGYGGETTDFSMMFRYMPYILLCMCCYCMSYILLEFQKPEIKRRMACAPVSRQSRSLQILLGFLILGLAFWLVCLGAAVLICGTEFLRDVHLWAYLLNSFLIMLVSLSVAFCVGSMVRPGEHAESVLNGVVNVAALGMSFLGGVFVPLELLGDGVKKAVHFLPVYWYEANNDLLSKYAVLDGEQLQTLWRGYAIQILFAGAIVCAGLAAVKLREREA